MPNLSGGNTKIKPAKLERQRHDLHAESQTAPPKAMPPTRCAVTSGGDRAATSSVPRLNVQNDTTNADASFMPKPVTNTALVSCHHRLSASYVTPTPPTLIGVSPVKAHENAW